MFLCTTVKCELTIKSIWEMNVFVGVYCCQMYTPEYKKNIQHGKDQGCNFFKHFIIFFFFYYPSTWILLCVISPTHQTM